MKMAIATLAALSVAGAAHGQTITCSDTYYGMPQLGQTCKSSAPSGPVDPQTVSAKPCTFAERHVFSVPDNICEARAVAAQHKAVGDLIAAGRCDEALKAALSTGDLTYAGQVKAFCGH